MNKAVFLDRDGVINELVYHQEQEVIDSPFTIGQFKIIKAVPESLKKIQSTGYLLILVSNQPGVAKGQMSMAVFNKIKDKMNAELARAGVKLDAEYYCFHHPESKILKYKVDCNCRKPKPGMLLQASRDLHIDLEKSYMVGDNISDIKAGKDAGCYTVLIGKMKCGLCNIMNERGIKPDIIESNISEATEFILSKKQYN